MVDPAAPKKSASKKRLQWDDLPAKTQADIARFANGHVVTATNRTGGFSPGLASRLDLTGGRRVFVKAMDAVEWPDQATWYRADALISHSLPPDVPAPRLRASSDDGHWVVLVFEYIDGAEPDLRRNRSPQHAHRTRESRPSGSQGRFARAFRCVPAQHPHRWRTRAVRRLAACAARSAIP